MPGEFSVESQKARQEGTLGITQFDPLILPMKRQRPREGSCHQGRPLVAFSCGPLTPRPVPSLHSPAGHQVSLSIYSF